MRWARAGGGREEASRLQATGARALGQFSVTEPTRWIYARLWDELSVWAARRQAVSTIPTVDTLRAERMDQQYLPGRSPGRGSYRVAAVNFMIPLCTQVELGLPFTYQALRGWRWKAPPHSRLPLPGALPWGGVALIARALPVEGRRRRAMYVSMTFMCYLRPSEALRVCGEALTRPIPGTRYRHWTLCLHPREQGTPSKTQVYDEVLPFDLEVYRFIETGLDRLKRGTPHGERLFNFALPEATAAFVEAASTVGLRTLSPHLAQLRHSGPSVELALKLRTLEAVKLRGRWKSDGSMARYLKEGRVGEQLQRLPPVVRARALAAPARLPALLARR